MAEPLPLHCPHCGEALTVEVEIGAQSVVTALWTCPYCHGALDLDVGGRIVWVAKAEESEDGLSRH